jgi:3-deoxy-D-manno-octulosonic-acid transferase
VIYPVYSALVATALVAGYGPAAVARYLAHGVPLNLRERLGYAGGTAALTRHGWVHAVSVGEAIAAAPIVAGVRGLYPELPLVMTTVTSTGAHVVRERYGPEVEHRYLPVDLPGAVRRVTATIDPAFLILIETELWPNLLRHLGRLGVPVMIANGRLSDRSFPRYRLVRPFVGRSRSGRGRTGSS